MRTVTFRAPLSHSALLGTHLAVVALSCCSEQGQPGSIPSYIGPEGQLEWGQVDEKEKFLQGYRRGQEEADSEIEAGALTLYTAGTRPLGVDLDEETGLPIRAIAGCLVTDAIIGRHTGHNDKVMHHIKEHGLPSYSRKRWMDDLLDLRGYFDRESSRGQPVIVSPDAAAVELAKGPYVVDVHWKRGTLSLIEVHGGLCIPNITHSLEVLLKRFRAGRAQFLWGPEGSDTLLAKLSSLKDPHAEAAFLLLDLRTNGHLLLLEVVRHSGAFRGQLPAMQGTSADATLVDEKE